jgi:hypothetical protein
MRSHDSTGHRMSGSASTQTVLTLTLKEDLAALREAVDKGAPNDVIIFANRFLSDVALFSAPTGGASELTIGTTLRIMGEDLLQVKARKPRADLDEELIDLAVTFVNQVAKALPTIDQDYTKSCAAFYSFERGVSLHQQTTEERTAYADLKSLHGSARSALGKLVTAGASGFSAPRSMFAEGLLNEFARLSRVHEFDSRDLCFYTGLKSYQLLNEYYRYLMFPIEGELESPDRGELAKERASYVEKLVSFVSRLDNAQTGDEWLVTREMVAPTIRRWRELFVIYMQPGTGPIVPTLIGQGIAEQPKPAGERTKK